ncbi:hypothetical protein Y032_0016g3010 [Ancylostoma ceylanicum]|uniref:Uncharacterized protein n=1 Tax=Ancylostoma ceylanicum TaxID=53326 RepID=A0A016V6J0_9BILA|nr:hypothetical protein Y032_0016g3010 [Ancylostoma ceylanicum]
MVKSAYWEQGLHDGWDIAADGAYDSRGFSAYYCKVLAVNLKTRLCIHTEVVHSSETGEIGGRMEKEGFRRFLLWFADQGLQIRSVTSDRHAHFKAVIDELNRSLSWNMEWYYDHWHLCRYLVKAIREASKRRAYTPFKPWIKSLKAHMKCAAESGLLTGDRDNIRFFFNICLYHIAGIHSWDQNDLSKLSPHGGTSQCETKNALDRLYCPKDVYFPPWTYPAYVALSTLYLNTLRPAEMSGNRVVERGYLYQRKFNDDPIRMVHKTVIDHRWRKEIRDENLRTRLMDLEPNQTDDGGVLNVEEGGPEDALDTEERLGYIEGYSDDDVGGSDEEDLDLPSELRFLSAKNERIHNLNYPGLILFTSRSSDQRVSDDIPRFLVLLLFQPFLQVDIAIVGEAWLLLQVFNVVIEGTVVTIEECDTADHGTKLHIGISRDGEQEPM